MSASQLVADRFKISDLGQDLLGRGGMGEVYRATDTQTGKLVAVKALNPEVVARAPDLVQRFVREGQALRQLNHPNIVSMVAAVEEGGRHYLVMEYVAGGSLADALAAQGRLPGSRVVEIALDLADALARAHRLGIIHRDLKPANVLLAQDGTPRLADFGIAHVVSGQRLTQTGVLMGTIDYLSPEVCQGQPPDERADIWAFGVLLFEMLTGRLPFEGTSITAKLTAILTQAVPDLAQLVSDAPAALMDLVYRMLAKDPQQRIPSVRLVGAELEAILKGRETTPAQLASAGKTPARIMPSPSVPPFMNTGQDIERPAFVTRESELAQLHRHLDRTLEGHGQVVFVTGDSGQGKTALSQEFAWRAQKDHLELVVASGNCNAFTGIGDPYLPFREILGLLCGDIETRWEARAIGKEQASRLWQSLPLTVQALVDSGHDLIDIFVSGDTLVRRAAAFAPWSERGEWLPRLEQMVERKATTPGTPDFQQSALFEQYTRVVRALARHKPLLLMLDDLQWADSGSINLLFHLGKRIEGSRVMLLGTYRPAEVALGRGGERHPLEPIVNEFKRQFGDIQIDLEKADRRQFVDALVDIDPNCLSEDFRARLCRLSGGHPLGTIELLRDMQERGGLVRDSAGRWVEGAALDWETLPARIEGMIAERIERLADMQRQALRIASVEGETFTAEIVAQVLGVEGREMVRLLSHELDKRHHLVSAQNIRPLNGQRLSMYRFRHILFQRYLYSSLDPVERPQLHQAIGTVLQTQYGERAEEIAVQLAWHFQEAALVDKAVTCLQQAGEQARRRYANEEAIAHLRQALSLLAKAPRDLARQRVTAELYERLGDVLLLIGRSAEAKSSYSDALAWVPQDDLVWRARLHRRIGKAWEGQRYYHQEVLRAYDLAETTLGQEPIEPALAWWQEWIAIQLDRIWTTFWSKGPWREMLALAEKTRSAVQQYGTPAQRSSFYECLVLVDNRRYRYVVPEETVTNAQTALATSQEAGDLSQIARSQVMLGFCHLWCGELDKARDAIQAALILAERIGDMSVQLMGLTFLPVISRKCGQVEETRHLAARILAVAREQGSIEYEGMARANLAWVAWCEGNLDEAQAHGQAALELWRPPIKMLFWSLALWPLICVELARDQVSAAIEHARALLDPEQQPLPEALAAVVERAITAWNESGAEIARKHLERAIELAQELGCL